MENIYLIVGESGSGKTSLVNALEERYGLKSVQSYTTRPKRTEDETGHIFITEKDFQELTDIVAYTYYNGNHYCATAEQLNDNDLYVIDIVGINSLKEKYKGRKSICVIYISSPIHTRVNRMEQRGDEFGKIMERIVNDTFDFKGAADMADFVIHNEDDTDFNKLVKTVYECIAIREVGTTDFIEENV